MTYRGTLIIIGFLTSATIISTHVAAQPVGLETSQLIQQTVAVRNHIQIGQNLLSQILTGVVMGLGLGTVIGSVLVYAYWDRKLP